MKIVLIGSNGFVGSAFRRLLEAKGGELVCVTRQNYAEHAGTSADVVIEAACNSKKFFAEEKPFEEFDTSVGHRFRTLRDFPAPVHLHISSVDVYEDLTSPATTGEDTKIAPENCTYYGLHKLMSEDLVRKYAREWLIVRLAGMVGPGLRKNPVYDILNGQPLRIHPESRYQFLATDEAARISWDLLESGVRSDVLNVCGAGTVRPLDIAELAGKPLDLSQLPATATPRVVDISVEKVGRLFPIPESSATVAAFIAQQKG